MTRPDGMATMADERSHMREMARDSPDFNYDIVMYDAETGERIGVTDSTYTEEEAEEALKQCKNAPTAVDGVNYKIESRD